MLWNLITRELDFVRSIWGVISDWSEDDNTIFIHCVWQESIVEEEISITLFFIAILEENFAASWDIFLSFQLKTILGEVPHSIDRVLIVTHINHWNQCNMSSILVEHPTVDKIYN